jgi:hypothetical protein
MSARRVWLMAAAASFLLTAGPGCGDSARLTAPSSPRQPPAAISPPPPADLTPFPPLSGAATTYRFSEALDYPVRNYTERSSIVLYESGGCSLQYESTPWELRGRYEHDEAGIRFYFSERTSPPDATGLVRGDVLEMRFSLMMQHSDFENAVYRRVF